MKWLWREVVAPWQDPMAVINPLVFLLLSITLFALAVPEQALVEHGAAVLWVMVLLTNVLSLDGLFRRAFDNGTLEQMLLQAPVPALAVAGRLLVHWLYSGLLIAILSPLLGGLLGLPKSVLGWVAAVLLIGSPALTLLGGMGAGLTVGMSRGGVLLGLLVLPLLIPVLIFGTSAIQEQVSGSANLAPLYWLGFMSMLALLVGPFATLAGLRISVQLH